MDPRLVIPFLAVVEQGSLSAAARVLGSSQPTLGRQMREMEAAVGAPLFDRHAQGLTPTARALALVPPAQAMRDAQRRLNLVAAGGEEAVAGTVRVTASKLVAHHLLPPVLVRLREVAPEVQVELVPSDSTQNLLFREADIALRMYRPTQADVIAKKLADLPLALYAARSYVARRGMPGPDAIEAHDWVGYDRSTLMIDGMAALGIAVARETFALRCDDHATCWELVRAGGGIGATQAAIGDADPGVMRVLEDYALPSLPLWLTAARALRQSARIRLVYDHLAAAFG
ncbi:LysR family transcriptional regulator [Roseobacter sp. HKCCA0434]|uniref:LysR family transcriptional regulator n=1 Tax=Roseobacter sp. HKCCA0434 TaxID=3079297 RepID=UPI002905B497|nr:LysR family transcriptional regulator [Roseobacter sp. HKCCA0434]